MKVSMAAALTTCVLAGCADDLELGGDDVPTWEEFEAQTYKEPWAGGVYIVDGDTPIATKEDLRRFYDELYAEGDPLIVHNQIFDDRWSPERQRDITYCVSTASFGSRHARVVAAMETATKAWESAANVDFRYRQELDNNCDAGQDGVVFDVREVANQPYHARAFLPSFDRSSRNLLIDTKSYDATPWTLTGILKHELGHTLGFLHEHIRPEAGTCVSDTTWRALTPYDSASVMHYPHCNGTQTGDLALTALDHAGAAALYGASAGILWQESSGSLATWSMNGGAVVGEQYPGSADASWQIQGTGDFNGDAGQDILWRNTRGQVAIWYMAGGLRIREGYPGGEDTGHVWAIQGVGDFDASGTSDILWRNNTGHLAIWLDGDAQRAVYPAYRNQPGPVDLAWSVKGVADVSGDGQADIIWRRTDGQVAIWHMSGGRWLAERQPGGLDASGYWQIRAFGDFDGDSTDDILWRNGAGELAIWFAGDSNRAGYPAYRNTPGPGDLAWQIQGVADFDGDGKGDILWRHTNGQVGIWLMDGAVFVADIYPRLVATGWAIKGVFTN